VAVAPASPWRDDVVMAAIFQSVPEWLSWENQGANVAVADLDGDGTPDLIVLRVDHPTPGPNVASYRVGRGLDKGGDVTGGWGAWIDIPDWGSQTNHGAGIAVADFGAARRALVVFQIENRGPMPNRGLYRIGRALDAQGKVTGGWSEWREVPEWGSWRDQGGAIATADLDGDGTPELVVFHVDNFNGDHPDRPNKGFYRIGQGLAEDGSVASWNPWHEVDWTAWFNQGAGIAVADLNGDKRPELIVFQIDHPDRGNAGWYRVGWILDVQGQLGEGWGPWVRVDPWGSWQDQGGGIALASFGGSRPAAVVFHVDNPDGLNAGLFEVIDLELDIDQSSVRGVWRVLPYLSEVLPIHAALLHTGKLLFFAGSGNSLRRFQSGDFGNEAKGVYTSVLWDPVANSFEPPGTLKRVDGSVVDFFCCGHCFLPDGRLLVIGGTGEYDVFFRGDVMVDAGHGFRGIKDALIFDPGTKAWSALQPMVHGRWYPTAVMLADGSVVALSGQDENLAVTEAVEQNTAPDKGAWQPVRIFGLPLYPHCFLTAAGQLFFTGGKMDTTGDSFPMLFDPLKPTAAIPVPGLPETNNCNQCASVILPPAQDQQVMLLGGGPKDEDGQQRGEATQRVAVVDLRSQTPTYAPKASLNKKRMHVNAVLLPDRTVLAAGGGVTREASAQPAQMPPGTVLPDGVKEDFVAEIYDPSTDMWTETAIATVARLYHSVALLLPDGRVVTASGNPDKGQQVPWLPPDPREEMRLEIYSPPYLFRFDAVNPRPEITQAPDAVTYGEKVTIATPQAANIQSVSLISAGLTTHSFNATQRLFNVPFQSLGTEELEGTIEANRNVAPPGWYMLFLMDNRKVPSVGKWLRLS
jgi:Domain of unknown function (DUF1929)/FG-GAP-like repeat